MYIDQLPNLPSADGTERIPVAQNGVDFAATPKQIVDATVKIDLLLDEKSIGTTATSFPCLWSGYDLLIIACAFYSNIMNTIVLPVSAFTATTASGRPFVADSIHGKNFEVYRDGTSSVYIKGGQAADATYGVRIYGVKF